MRNFVTEYAWKTSEDAEGAGAILLTYDHDSHGVQETLTDIQHQFRGTINSTTHIHLDESKCLEIISVRGKMKRVHALARAIMRRRGIMQLKVSIVGV